MATLHYCKSWVAAQRNLRSIKAAETMLSQWTWFSLWTVCGTGWRTEDRRVILHVCPLPAGLPLDELNGLEGLVHVSDGEVEAEVEHGVASGPFTLLQTNKVPQCSSGHHVRLVRGRTPRRLLLPWRRRWRSISRIRVLLARLTSDKPSVRRQIVGNDFFLELEWAKRSLLSFIDLSVEFKGIVLAVISNHTALIDQNFQCVMSQKHQFIY